MVQVMVKAFPWNTAPAYLVRDNDGAYGQAFLARIRTIGIRDHPISRKLPWQNPCAERLIGTLRRDCLDHVPIFGERHLLRILSLYSAYYNQTRTHLGLDKDAPLRRAVQPNGTIVTTPIFLDCTIGPPGRPRVSPELRKLIRRMSKENPMWAPHASMVNSYPDLGRTAFAMVLSLYSLYYNGTRTHLGLGEDAPLPRSVQRSGTIVTTPILSGLHHRYVRI